MKKRRLKYGDDYLSWDEIQLKIENCIKCKRENQLQVLYNKKKLPVIKPRRARLLFVSEAPPSGKNYFYWKNSKDNLRKRIFYILNRLGYKIKSLQDFVNTGFYLVPTVKCASQKNGKNKNPSNRVIKLCINHLKDEIEVIKPKTICLLGRTALYGFSLLFPQIKFSKLKNCAGQIKEINVKTTTVRVMITYWSTNRQRKFNEIIKHIKLIDSISRVSSS